ncbi:universal stress protein [Paeniglutamicibacter sp. NPDC091659]|uniref:universal stress protein n=1 Tax=Paeniglutamicibacter sp. NPDC091659 TaxID=3364389 RepID=UPI00382B1AEC
MNNEATFNTTNPVPEPASSDSIVVGHDGSKGANHAFDMAMGLAAELSAPVVVVRSWSILTAPRPADWEYGYVSSFAEYTAAVREEMVLGLKETVGKYDKVQVTYEPVHAPPAKSLIDCSRNARMLVVGTRGHGGLAGMLLGSVSEQCVRHAACPVLVVRPKA